MVLRDVSFSSGLVVGGDVSFNSRLIVLRDVSFSRGLVVGGDVSFNSRLIVSKDASFKSNVDINGKLTITLTNFNEPVTIIHPSVSNDTARIDPVLTLKNATLPLAGRISFYTDITRGFNGCIFDGDSVIMAAKYSTGESNSVASQAVLTLTTHGKSTGGVRITEDSVRIYGGAYFNGATNLIDASFNGKVDISGATVLKNTLYVANDASFNGKVDISGLLVRKDASFNGKVDINGVLKLNAGTLDEYSDFIDQSNRTQTYIHFGIAGTTDDFALLRQIGAPNQFNLALDFYDDFEDAGFVIRDIRFNGASTDSVLERFKVKRGGGVEISNGADASSTTAGGSLTVSGGAAVSQKLFVGGITQITNTSDAGSATDSTAALLVKGGVGIEKKLYVGAGLNVKVNATTEPAYIITADTNTTNMVALTLENSATTSKKRIHFIPYNAGGYNGVAEIGDSLIMGQNTNSGVLVETSALTLTTNSNYSGGVRIYQDTVKIQGKVTMPALDEATSSTTGGALLVSGGVGIAKKLYVGGPTFLTKGDEALSTTNGGTLTVSGGAAVSGKLFVGGITTFTAIPEYTGANATSLTQLITKGAGDAFYAPISTSANYVKTSSPTAIQTITSDVSSANPALSINHTSSKKSFAFLTYAGPGSYNSQTVDGDTCLLAMTDVSNSTVLNLGVWSSFRTGIRISSQQVFLNAGSGNIQLNSPLTTVTGNVSMNNLSVTGATTISGATIITSNSLNLYDRTDTALSLRQRLLFMPNSTAASFGHGGLVVQGDSVIMAAKNNALGTIDDSCVLTITTHATTGAGIRITNNSVSMYGPTVFNNTVTATSFNATSDYRMKRNVQTLDSQTIDPLNPVEYDLSGGKHDMGFLAHEVQEVFPFLVEGEKDGKQIQSLNYNGFIALLVKEVKDLKKENIALKSQNTLFERRLQALEAIVLK